MAWEWGKLPEGVRRRRRELLERKEREAPEKLAELMEREPWAREVFRLAVGREWRAPVPPETGLRPEDKERLWTLFVGELQRLSMPPRTARGYREAFEALWEELVGMTEGLPREEALRVAREELRGEAEGIYERWAERARRPRPREELRERRKPEERLAVPAVAVEELDVPGAEWRWGVMWVLMPCPNCLVERAVERAREALE
ncbi:hypothetical protein DRN94_004345, partial [archaeon]|nr:hypothetical protein [archaeon]